MMDELGVNGTLPRNGTASFPRGPRVLVGIRDPRLERPLFPGSDAGAALPLRVVGRALDGDSLLAQAEDRTADAILVSDDLPGLTPALLQALTQRGLALLAVPTSTDALPPSWQELGVRELIPPLDPTTVARAIQTAVHQRKRSRRGDEPVTDEPSDGGGTLLTVTSGKGSPGKTTVALNLAVGLAARGEEVCLVDLDVTGGDIVAYLGLDPRANLFTLAHAAAGQRALTADIVTPELQLFGQDSFLWVLVGIARPRMANALTEEFVRSLLTYLRGRFGYVVVDQAALPHGSPALTRVILEQTARVLVVGGGDLVAAWHVQQAIATLTDVFAVSPERLALVLNRHDPKRHPSREEIARAMEWEGDVLGTIPYDYRAAQEAQRDQRPLILSRGAVGRALEALAQRVQTESARVETGTRAAVGARPRRHWPHLALRRRRN